LADAALRPTLSHREIWGGGDDGSILATADKSRNFSSTYVLFEGC
jgi:hypothetical protein